MCHNRLEADATQFTGEPRVAPLDEPDSRGPRSSGYSRAREGGRVVARRDHRKGGRVTPKGTRPADRRGGPRRGPPAPPRQSLEELLLRNATDAVAAITTVGEAEDWASAVQRLFRPRGLDPAPDVTVPATLAAAAAHGVTAAAVLAATLAVFGPQPGRHEARRLWRRMVADGVAVPDWVESLGDVAPVRAVRLTDAWDDECMVLVDFVRPDGTVCGLGVDIDRIFGGVAHGFMHGPTTEILAAAVADDPYAAVVEIGLADARAMIAEGLRERDGTVGPGDYGDDAPDPDDPDELDEDLRALVDQRIGLLPLGGDAALPRRLSEEEAAAIADAFLEWPHGQDRHIAQDVAETIVWFGSYCYDGDPLHWSPPRITGFLTGWIPETVVAEEEWLAALESVFPRWLEYAAERRGLDAGLLERNLSVARDSFGAMRHNADDPSRRSPTTSIVREMLADGIDPSDPADSAAVAAWMDQYNARPRRERY